MKTIKKLSLKEKELELDYIAAKNDEARNKEIAEWDAIEKFTALKKHSPLGTPEEIIEMKNFGRK